MEKANEFIGKSLYCIKSDKLYGITKDAYYKIIGMDNRNNVDFYIIDIKGVSTGFKEGTKYFLSVMDSLNKVRYKKFEKIVTLDDE